MMFIDSAQRFKLDAQSILINVTYTTQEILHMADPLQEQDLDTINANLNQLKLANEQIRKAEAAGINVTDLKNQANEQRQQLLKIKQTFFPNASQI